MNDPVRGDSPVGNGASNRLTFVAQAALLIVASVVIYWPVLQPGAGFLWDDANELWGTRGDLVQASNGPLIAWFPIEKPAAGWHDVPAWRPLRGHGFWPLTPTAFWLEWRLFGADERWAAAEGAREKHAAVEAIANRFHWPGVLMHGLNAALVVLLMRRLGLSGAFWVGAVFVVHPVNVPSVAWVSELKNTLSLFWLLVAVLGFLRGLGVSGGASQAAGDRWRIGALVAFFLSLSAKTAGVGLPVILMGLVWWLEGRVTRRRALQLLPFFGLSLIMGLTTIWFVGQSGGMTAEVETPASVWARLAAAGWVPWFYAWKTLLPTGLAMIYPQIRVGAPWVIAFLPSLACVGVLGAAIWVRRPGGWAVLLALIAYLVLLFPVAGFIDMTFMMHSLVSDHFHYMSMVPLLALGVGGSFELVRSHERLRVALVVGWALACIVLACQANGRAEVFKTQRSLWTHNVAVNPDAWMAQYNLGSLLEIEARGEAGAENRQARLREALAHLERAAALKPVYENASYREGVVHAELGEDREAIDAWERSVAAASTAVQPNTERMGLYEREIARGFVRLGEPATSLIHFERSLNYLPAAWKVRLELASALEALGRDRAAVSQYRHVLERRPRADDALVGLALLLSTSRDPGLRQGDEAIGLARAAFERASGDPHRRLRALHALAAAHAESASAIIVEEEAPEEVVAEGSAQREAHWMAADRMALRATRLADRLDDPDERARANARQALYLDRTPYRRPTPMAPAGAARPIDAR